MNQKFPIEESKRIIDALATTVRGTYYGFILGTFLLIGVLVLEVFNFKLFGWSQ